MEFTFHSYSKVEVEAVNTQEVFTSYAPEGSVSTPMFKKQFDSDKFEFGEKKLYKIIIKAPYMPSSFDRIFEDFFEEYQQPLLIYDQKYKISINYDIADGKDTICLSTKNVLYGVCLEKNGSHYDTDMITSYGNVSVNIGSKEISFDRFSLSRDEFQEWKNKRFTGFKVSWNCPNCTGKMDDQQSHKAYTFNKIFVKLANIVHKIEKVTDFADNLKHQKTQYPQLLSPGVYQKWIIYDVYNKIIDKAFENLSTNFTLPLEAKYSTAITNQTLKTAANLIIYLTAPSQLYWRTFHYHINSMTILHYLEIRTNNRKYITKYQYQNSH